MKNQNCHGRTDNGQGQGGSSEVIKIWAVPETVLRIETLGNLKRKRGAKMAMGY